MVDIQTRGSYSPFQAYIREEHRSYLSSFFKSHIVIIVIIQALPQLCWVQLHKFYFFIPVYPGPNPPMGGTSSSLFLRFSSMSSSLYPFSLRGHKSEIERLFPTCVVVGLYWTVQSPYHLKRISLKFSPINATPRCPNALFFFFFFF